MDLKLHTIFHTELNLSQLDSAFVKNSNDALTVHYLAIFMHCLMKVFGIVCNVAAFDVAMNALYLAWSPRIFKSAGLVWKAKIVLPWQQWALRILHAVGWYALIYVVVVL